MIFINIHFVENGKYTSARCAVHYEDINRCRIQFVDKVYFFDKESIWSKDYIMYPIFGLDAPKFQRYNNIKIAYIEVTDDPVNTISNMLKLLDLNILNILDVKKMAISALVNHTGKQSDLMKKFFIRYIFEVK